MRPTSETRHSSVQGDRKEDWLRRIVKAITGEVVAPKETIVLRCVENRHYLAGRQVYDGDILKLWSGKEWTPARYDLNSAGEGHLVLGDDRTIALKNNPRVCWPEFWDDAGPLSSKS
jgi:hypothetical protein